jgi:hypothetical protein
MTEVDPEFSLPIELPLDNYTGPASRLPRERASAMVAAAMSEWGAGSSGRESHTGPRAASGLAPRPAAWLPWAAAAATVLTIASGVAAARFYFHTGDAHGVVHGVIKAPLQPTATATVPAPTATQNQTQEQTNAVETPSLKSDKPGRSTPRSAPEDLLQKANQQRAAAQFKDAASSYASVYERYPHTLSAYVARVAAGSLALEHLQSPKQARALFEQAMRDRPQGALDLEARQGLALALRDLGDSLGERKALRALVANHAGSPAAKRAEQRLHELGNE